MSFNKKIYQEKYTGKQIDSPNNRIHLQMYLFHSMTNNTQKCLTLFKNCPKGFVDYVERRL